MLELVLVTAVVLVFVMIAKALAFVLKFVVKFFALCLLVLIFMALARMLGLC